MKAQRSSSGRVSVGQVLVIAIVAGFSVLILGGYGIWKARAPVPGCVERADGTRLFGATEIKSGQALYQKHGLMDWGSVLGHGTYLGPDFTAETLHRRVELLRDAAAHAQAGRPFAELEPAAQAAIAESVRREIRHNGYEEPRDTLVLGADDAAAFESFTVELRRRFAEGEPQRGLPAGLLARDSAAGDGAWVAPGDPAREVAAFFWWTAWLAGADRPGEAASYTNEWPYDTDAGNELPVSAHLWSGVSVAALLFLLALVLLAWYRGRFEMEPAYVEGRMPQPRPGLLPVFESQRKAIKYFVLAGVLFLVQSLLGGYLAHHYVEGSAFYGVDMARWLPFSVAKTWHLQLAIFWIATAWMGMGLYVAPIVGGAEPRGQGRVVDLLFGALVLVAVGSLAGEWLGVQGYLGSWWWLLGHSGWELIELGYIWKILLAAGFGLWLFAVWRPVRAALSAEKKSEGWGLARLFLASAIAIPAMFGAAFLITPGMHLTMADYWRWWVIHLWVEGMFEVFAVVVLGLLLVNMGLVTRSSAVRALKFQLAILLGSGIIGIGHHYYWIGAPGFWIALGSIFSALEVIPLTLLAVEAAQQWKLLEDGGRSFAYRQTFRFLLAVAFWNLFGAGVLGFLINLPSVSYFEHGSFLTANHGHAATMGVFGMLAIALALYCMRNATHERVWPERLFTLSFWGLNVGLLGMVAITLTPVGVLQVLEAGEHGFWSARSLEFYTQPRVQQLLWLRAIPDTIFILFGVTPLLAGMWIAWRGLRPIGEPLEQAAPRGAVPALQRVR